MIIRKDTDYAFRCLLYLVTSGKGSASCDELTEACNVPRSFTHKILRSLRRKGILESRVGRGGGFSLRKPTDKISLFDVVEAVQGSPEVSACVTSPDFCRRRRGCPLSTRWRNLQKDILSFLKSVTLADLLSSHR